MNMLYDVIRNNIDIIEVPIKTIYENNNKLRILKLLEILY